MRVILCILRAKILSIWRTEQAPHGFKQDMAFYNVHYSDAQAGCAGETRLLLCTYLSHHELESIVSIMQPEECPTCTTYYMKTLF